MGNKKKYPVLGCLWRTIKLGILLLLLTVGFVIYAYFSATWAARGKAFDHIDELPKLTTGLVFGTSDRFRGRENLYFRYRIDAAKEVWRAGKVQTFIVSGDNRSKYYNEPEKMKAALVRAGVPAQRIVCDYAGLRTLDSIVRAKKIFGVDRLIVISQGFQNERAIYLAQANGMEAYGFNAKDVDLRTGYKTQARELGARVKMWLDIHFLNTRPTHLGEKIQLPK